jgi:hypothetical protein
MDQSTPAATLIARLIAPVVLDFFILSLGSKFCVRLKEKLSKLAVVSSSHSPARRCRGDDAAHSLKMNIART